MGFLILLNSVCSVVILFDVELFDGNKIMILAGIQRLELCPGVSIVGLAYPKLLICPLFCAIVL